MIVVLLPVWFYWSYSGYESEFYYEETFYVLKMTDLGINDELKNILTKMEYKGGEQIKFSDLKQKQSVMGSSVWPVQYDPWMPSPISVQLEPFEVLVD